VLPNGLKPCWLVTAPPPRPQTPAAPFSPNPWLVAPVAEAAAAPVTRLDLVYSDDAQFNFAEVRVELPSLFSASLTLDSLRSLGDRTADQMPAESLLTEAARRLGDAGPASPFDRATLPTADGVEAQYGGQLTTTFGGQKLELPFEADIRTVGAEAIDGIPHRWIEITTRSWSPGGQQHQEQARLLIDKTRYDQGEFVVRSGWWTMKDHVFAYDPSGDMATVEEDLHFLGAPLPLLRFSVHDALVLLFDARPQAAVTFNNLRTGFLSRVGGPSPLRQRTWGQFMLRNEEMVRTVTWSWSEGDVSRGGASYLIQRSPRLPFDFAEVKVQTGDLTFSASLKEPRQKVNSKLGSPDDLAALASRTSTAVAHARESKPNWRLWTLTGRPRLWAEYATTLGDRISLRDEHGRMHSVTRTQLSRMQDISLVDDGRTWYRIDGKPLFRGHVERVTGIRVEFKGERSTFRTTEFSPVDQKLLEQHRPATEPPQKPRRKRPQ
jgi:hypothetical protein